MWDWRNVTSTFPLSHFTQIFDIIGYFSVSDDIFQSDSLFIVQGEIVGGISGSSRLLTNLTIGAVKIADAAATVVI